MMVELSIVPLSKDAHLGKPVAEAVKIIAESGLEYRLTPMGTILVGEWESIMKVVRQCHEAVCKSSDRVITKIKIDDFKGQEQRMPEDKVKSVEQHLRHEVKK